MKKYHLYFFARFTPSDFTEMNNDISMHVPDIAKMETSIHTSEINILIRVPHFTKK